MLVEIPQDPDRDSDNVEERGSTHINQWDSPMGPLTYFNDGRSEWFFASEILANSGFLGSMKDAGIFLGGEKKTRGIYLGCEKRTKGLFWVC